MMKRMSLFLLAVSACGALLSINGSALTWHYASLPQGVQKARATVASIRKKNGQILKGQIKGQIVQGTEEQMVKDGDSVSYVQTHSLVNGKDIVTIDASGIKTTEGAEIQTVTLISYSPPSNTRKWSDIGERLTLMEQLLALGVPGIEEKGQWKIIPVKGVSERVESDPQAPKVKLLGEFKSGRIIPAIEIVSAKGTVTVPVSEIVVSSKRVH